MTDGAAVYSGVRIAGTGSHLPGRPLNQDEVRELLRRSADGLTEREQDRLLETSGIETRHYAIDPRDATLRESNATMAAEAGRQALDAAGWQPDDVDFLVVTTVVPDQLMPPTSTLVQEKLGVHACAELEISSNCTAPTKALMVAAAQIRLGVYRRVLVCCSQLASFAFFPPWANPSVMRADQGHLRWILSDGASAIALESGVPDIELRIHLESRGVGRGSGMSVALGATTPDLAGAYERGLQHVTQPPMTALKQGIRLASQGLTTMLRAFEIPGSTIDHFVPSVSSVQVERHLQELFSRQGVRPEAWRTNFTRVGYIGSVAVPVMLDEMARSGQLRAGDVVCTVAEESSKWMFAGTVFRWNP